MILGRRGVAHLARRRITIGFSGFITVLVAWVFWGNLQQLQSDRALACRQAERYFSERDTTPPHRSVMSFSVCNGLTNQRISIMTGLCIGKLLNRDIILPRVSQDYRDAVQSPFSSLFDVKGLSRLLHPRLLLEDRAEAYRSVNIRVERAMKPPAYFEQLAQEYNTSMLLMFDCTLFALNFGNDEELLSYAWEVHKALRFAPHIHLHAAKITRYLQSRTLFVTVLHGRFEQDWIEHCATWSGGFNCMSVSRQMLRAVQDLSRSRLIYIAVSNGESLAAYSTLASNGYELVTKVLVSPELGNRPREETAAVDHLVAEAADLYIGTRLPFLHYAD